MPNIFDHSFLVSDLMCGGCGSTMAFTLNGILDDLKEEKKIPLDTEIIFNSEPWGEGIHRYSIYLTSDAKNVNLPATLAKQIEAKIEFFKVIDEKDNTQANTSTKVNKINIFINLLAIILMIGLFFTFPASIPLTISLAAISFLTTAFTARDYLINFFRNLRRKNLLNMTTTISLGWFLSLGHTIFHAVTMPITHSFSMMFMNVIMPAMLITGINIADEIKRFSAKRAQRLQLSSIETLFPGMSKCYRRKFINLNLQQVLDEKNADNIQKSEEFEISAMLNAIKHNPLTGEESGNKVMIDRNFIQPNMVIEVGKDECFPVDCVLVNGETIIDASVLTGEPAQTKRAGNQIPGGALNRGAKVIVLTRKNCYNSTANQLLFTSNRALEIKKRGVPKFTYIYSALVVIGILAAIITPIGLGVISASVIVTSIIGILFSVCPCTIALAHELPLLVDLKARNDNGIYIRNPNIVDHNSPIRTIVFDKTGTLTTGASTVESTDITDSVLYRLYLLEKKHGGKHPIAQAIVNYYQQNYRIKRAVNFDQVQAFETDNSSTGLKAMVQGKKICIGNRDYIMKHSNNSNITINDDLEKINRGYTAIYVTEDEKYQGVIYIKHQPKPGIKQALQQLKQQGIRLVMLTGDSKKSAEHFNQQMGNIFAKENIFSETKPADKEAYFKKLINGDTPGSKILPEETMFVCDGINDGPACKEISSLGGISCATDINAKSAFFADICLDGSLDYLVKHRKLNRGLKQRTLQNQAAIIYSTGIMLAFVIGFSAVGLALSPLIPMAIMLSTTSFVLFNAYRSKFVIDDALGNNVSWPKKMLASNFSIGLLFAASALLVCAILIASIATGGLALPLVAFSSGAIMAFCSVCSLVALGLTGIFGVILASHFLTDDTNNSKEGSDKSNTVPVERPKLNAVKTSNKQHANDNLTAHPKLFLTLKDCAAYNGPSGFAP